MIGTARAMVQTAPLVLEVRDISLPAIRDDTALVRVEFCGICGTDIERLSGRSSLTLPYPFTPGHEIVGVVEQIGDGAARRRRLAVGDRVAIDPFLACGACTSCSIGARSRCAAGRTYGRRALGDGSGLWGGFASHVEVPPEALVYAVPADVPADRAVLFNPLGAGFSWVVEAGEARPGSRVLVLGAGQRGLACVAAAASSGASRIVVTGLERDRDRLALAKELGAHETLEVESDASLALDRPFDVVVDTTPGSESAVADAIRNVAPGGRVVAAGLKGRPLSAFPLDRLINLSATIVGVKGVSSRGYEWAIEQLSDPAGTIGRLRTHTYPVDRAQEAIDLLAGRGGADAINVAVAPTLGR